MKFKILTMIARIFHFLFCLCECRCITYYWLLTTVTVVSNAPTTYSCSSFAVGGWDDYTYIQNDRISKNEKVCISAEQFQNWWIMQSKLVSTRYGSDYDFIRVVRIHISIAQLFIIFDKDFIRCHYEVDWWPTSKVWFSARWRFSTSS